MCSSCLQIVYNLLHGLSLGCMILATITPGWRIINTGEGKYYRGLLYQLCDNMWEDAASFDSLTSGGNNIKSAAENCMKDYWSKQLADWERAAAALMVIGCIAGVAASIFNCVMCCMICCKSKAAIVLIILTFVSFFADFLAVVVYATKQTSIDSDTASAVQNTFTSALKFSDSIGFSMYMAIISTPGMLAAGILAICVQKVSKVSPI